LQVLIYEDNAAGFSMLFDDDGEQFRHVIGKFATSRFSDAATHERFHPMQFGMC